MRAQALATNSKKIKFELMKKFTTLVVCEHRQQLLVTTCAPPVHRHGSSSALHTWQFSPHFQQQKMKVQATKIQSEHLYSPLPHSHSNRPLLGKSNLFYRTVRKLTTPPPLTASLEAILIYHHQQQRIH